MSAAVDAKAERYLAEGRVVAVRVGPHDAEFKVRGSEPYRVVFRGDWSCDCPAQVPLCAHVRACQKIAQPTANPVAFTGTDDLSALVAAALRS